jgi:3-oxoacyl-[acyl-carrier protein] reductase
MPFRLTPVAGTRIAVVGGCGGIGRAVVRAALDCGLRVTVLDLPASLRQAPPPEAARAIPIDVTDPASVAAAFAGLDGLDALVNLAGFTAAKAPVETMDQARWDGVLGANLTGAFLVARAALPLLREAGSEGAPGSLVHVSSGLAARLMPGYGPYGASKAGLIALTKSIAVENAPLVRANAVAPGAVDTEFLRGGTGRSATRAPAGRVRPRQNHPDGPHRDRRGRCWPDPVPVRTGCGLHDRPGALDQRRGADPMTAPSPIPALPTRATGFTQFVPAWRVRNPRRLRRSVATRRAWFSGRAACSSSSTRRAAR